MNDCEALANVPYFRGVKDEILCSVLEHSAVKTLGRGEYLFMADERCNNLFIIKKGMIEIFQLGDDGKKIVMHHAGEGAMLGDTILFNKEKFGAHASALEDSEILLIEKKSLEKLINDYPEISMRMLADFGKRIKRLEYFAAEIALNDVRKRIARLILELAEKKSTERDSSIEITDIPTQDDMANRIGTVRAVLCRELHKLEKGNIIEAKRGKIVIHDISKLKEIISFNEHESIFPITLPMKSHRT